MRYWVVIAGLIVAFALLEGYIHIQIKAGIQAGLLQENIKAQNDAIKSHALNTKSYLENAPQQQEKIITKYKTIELKDTSCEGKLKEIENALNIYFHHNINSECLYECLQ